MLRGGGINKLQATLRSPSVYLIGAVVLHGVAAHVLFAGRRTGMFPLLDALDLGLAGTLLLIESMRRDGIVRTKIEEALRVRAASLERRVERRTRQLREVNEALLRESDERERAERRLADESMQDALTGLANRRRFSIILDRRLAEAAAQPFAVIFIDLDHFKLINDGLGHTMGDRALVAIADRLDNLLKGNAVIGRVGGDEFALMTPVAGTDEALRVAERVLGTLKNPIAANDRIIYSAASLGVRYWDGNGEHQTAASLMRDAHTAMHRAKVQGRSRIVLFEDAMHAEAQQQLSLSTDLREAVERDEFFVEYQPVYSLVDGNAVGYEALVRWAHPRRGRVEPGVFIPTAENSGLVVPIGSTVLREVCAEISRRKITAATPVGINLSARQLAQPDLVGLVRRTLAEFHVDPAVITLEVTESVFVESLAMARDILSALKALGLKLAIDDFGTGYSSLSYLRELPFDVLKIDRSFVRRINEEAASRDIVRMLVRLAESLGMSVVAEGIETEEQLFCVRSTGCLKGQGYLFARPLPADEAFAATHVPLTTVLS